jgi:hypothetical protein
MTGQRIRRHTVVAGIALLLSMTPTSHGVATAIAQGNQAGADVTGTWFIRVPSGPGESAVGFYTYDHSGTVTGTVSVMFGGLPYLGGLQRLGSPDHGVWRNIPGGTEYIVYRMVVDPITSDIEAIVGIRGVNAFDGDRDHMITTFFISRWICPTPTTCPDPTSDPPDVPEFAPPGNVAPASRIRLP